MGRVVVYFVYIFELFFDGIGDIFCAFSAPDVRIYGCEIYYCWDGIVDCFA